MKFISLALCLLSLRAWSLVTTETEKAATRLGAAAVGEVEFKRGQSELTEPARKDLDQFIRDARQTGDIQEIRVIAWSDKEYPKKGVTFTKADISLAQERARVIRSYLEDTLHIRPISTYNMAERPNAIQKMFNTSTASTKKTLEKTGAAPHSEKHTGLFGERSKSSLAMILVYKRGPSGEDFKVPH